MSPVRSLIACAVLASLPAVPQLAAAAIAVGVSINLAPPALPVYVQPPCPGIGFMWTPGYWAYGDAGYYWVPGTWVQPPAVGLLWTPGYWGFVGSAYVWHAGYWGPHVGFYGGVNYGFGYGGVGFAGGYWHGSSFFYNRSVTNVGRINNINVYNHTVVNNVSHASFNGGHGGVMARPNAAERAADHDHHFGSTQMQQQHQRAAFQNPGMRATANGGHPAIGATARAGDFHSGVGGAQHAGGAAAYNHAGAAGHGGMGGAGRGGFGGAAHGGFGGGRGGVGGAGHGGFGGGGHGFGGGHPGGGRAAAPHGAGGHHR